MSLEAAAEQWIAPYWNARHLLRTRDWAVELDPDASLAVRLAALTHDIERMLPGGPAVDPRRPPDDEVYTREHSERSARLVAGWLREHGAEAGLIRDAEELVRLHEVGGTPGADLVQAADSISFLEVNGDLVIRWVRDDRATFEQAKAKLDWMLERIRVPEARGFARIEYDAAVAALTREAKGAA